MKKLHDFTLILVALAIGFSSCSQDKMTDTVGGGRLAIKVESNTDVVLPSTKNEQVDELPNVADFKLELYEKENLVRTWDRFSDFEQNSLFPSGSYRVKAFHGDITQEGFDKPYFEGDKSFQIITDEETQVNLTCYVANTKASIEYTDAFKKYFTEYSASIYSGSNNSILFSGTETRAAYFQPSGLTVELQVTNQQGTTSTLKAASLDQTLPKHHYRFKFDVDAGSATLKVTFDTSTAEDSVEIDISDDALNADPPLLIEKNFTSDNLLEIIEGWPASGSPVQVFIHAKSGIASCKLKIESRQLTEFGLPSESELVKIPAEQFAILSQFGISVKGLGENLDRMAVVDFTELIPQLYAHPESDMHKLVLEVVDRRNKITRSTLTVRSLDNGFAIEPFQEVTLGTEEIAFPVRLKGDASEIKFQILESGNWQDVSFSIQESKDDIHLLRAVFNKPVLEEMPVRLIFKRKTLNDVLPIIQPSFDVKALSDANVFAGYARLHVVGENAFATEYFKTKDIYVECALEGTDNWYKPEQTKTGDEIRIALPVDASKTNSFKIRSRWLNKGEEISGISESVITSEQALQLPNSGFEEWTEVMVWRKTVFLSGGESIYAFYPGGHWASYNDRTTQPRGDASWYYCAFPGMVPTAKTSFTAANHLNRFDGKSLAIEAHSGANAMEITTVGWGKNNWTSESSASAEYKQPGLMYLGSYDRGSQTEVHGMNFVSRPEAVRFFYKYYSYNAESAKVSVILEDAAHQEVGRGELRISADTQVFTEGRVPVVYSQLKKASFIRVEFRSTDAEAPQTQAVQGSKGAWNAGFGDSRHIGSILTVDDVSLIY